MKIEDLAKLNNVDEIIRVLVLFSDKDVLSKAVHDAILVEYVFPLAGEDFKETPFIPIEAIEKFKQQFDYKKYGIIDEQKVRNEIQSMQNIDRIIDHIVSYMPEDKQEQLAIAHIKKVWFEKNSNSDINYFLNNLNKDFWHLH